MYPNLPNSRVTFGADPFHKDYCSGITELKRNMFMVSYGELQSKHKGQVDPSDIMAPNRLFERL